jgi:phosphonate transport system ATP-binding protein
MTPVVRAHGVTKDFGGTRALDGVSLEVPAGELLVLVGLSGSGKSTLLRHLNGLHRPTRGSVEVLGTDLATASPRELRALRRRVGFVFQQFNLVGRSSCLENVLAGALGRVRGPRYGVLTYPKHLRREAIGHLDRVGLADRAHQRSDTLSGGQQQRVAIARTLMQGPELLLADEPVASLDPESSAQVMDVLFRICVEDRLTVVCSLHQVELALGWAHRLVGLRDGQKVLDRTAAHLDQADVMEVYRRVEPGAPRSVVVRPSPEEVAAARVASELPRRERSPLGERSIGVPPR